MLQRVVSHFTIPVLVNEAQDLFLKKTDPTFYIPPRSSLAISKGLEKAKQRMFWLEAHQDQVEEWLKAEGID